MQPLPSRPARLLLLVAAVYTLLAFLAYLPAWTRGAATHAQSPGGDIAIFVWSLRWVAYALTHGHNLLFSDWLNYPAGVNLLDNTSMLALGVLTAPVTLLFGPVASFNLVQTVALASSALAAFVLLRRWRCWTPAAFLGGLFYGFSPYMISSGWGHPHCTFGALVPLVILCLDEVITGAGSSPVRWGVGAGVLAAAQFFVSDELLAELAELVVVSLVLLAVLHRKELAVRGRRIATGVGAAVATAGVLLAYPAWYAVAGPQHGGIQPPLALTSFLSSDLLEPLMPTSNQLLTGGAVTRLGDRIAGGLIDFGGGAGIHQVTDAGYLGLPLLIALTAVVAWCWRCRRVRFVAAMSVVAFVLALGPTLRVDGHDTGIPLPEHLFTHLPLLRASVPFRYGLFVSLGAASLLALGLTRLYGRMGSGSGRLALVVPAVVAAAVLLPCLPRLPYTVVPTSVPAFFTSAAVQRLPAGSVALTYPPPSAQTSVTMTWQAAAGLRYRMIGAYMFAPADAGGFSLVPDSSPLESLLLTLWAGRPAPRLTRQIGATLMRQLHQRRVNEVIVVMGQPRAQAAIRLFTSLLGRGPRKVGGVALWPVLSSRR